MTIGGIIDALSFLIFDDLFFIINDILVDRFNEPTQLIRFGPYHFFKGVFGDGLKILRHIIRRKAVGAFAADAGVHCVQPAVAKIFGIEKKEMFE